MVSNNGDIPDLDLIDEKAKEAIEDHWVQIGGERLWGEIPDAEMKDLVREWREISFTSSPVLATVWVTRRYLALRGETL